MQNQQQNFQPRRLALAVAVALGSLPAGALAAAGRVQFAWGQVSVEQGSGGSAPLKRGDEVNAGDTIVTERGRAQIKFTDGSYVSLQPKTAFKIDEYKYGGGSGNERSFMSLFRGGLRAISGAIGRSSRADYRLNTPVATIGIRGTEYLIMLDDNGAIVTVGDGAIAMINDAGEVVLVNGQTGRIVDKNSLPVIVDGKAVVPPPEKDLRNDPGADEPQQDDDEFQISVSGDNGDPEDVLNKIVEGGIPGEPPVEPPVVPPPPPAPTMLESGPGFTVAYSYYSGNSESPINSLQSNVDATFSGGQLTAWTDGSTSSSQGQLSLVESGSDAYIGWGRWSNPDATSRSFTVAGTADSYFNANQSVHTVAGRPSDLAALASAGATMANYSVLSFTTPTDAFGNKGQFLGGSFGVDFANQQVGGSIDARMAMVDYNLSFLMSASGGTFSGPAGVSSGSGCFSGCNGFVSGLVAGPEAERAGVVYHIKDFDTFNDIFGAAAFLKDPNATTPSVFR